MNPAELRASVIATLQSIAPEIDPADLRDERPLRQQVDLDSMDWLHFLTGLHESLQADIAEADYGRLVTLADVLAYLQERLDKKGA